MATREEVHAALEELLQEGRIIQVIRDGRLVYLAPQFATEEELSEGVHRHLSDLVQRNPVTHSRRDRSRAGTISGQAHHGSGGVGLAMGRAPRAAMDPRDGTRQVLSAELAQAKPQASFETEVISNAMNGRRSEWNTTLGSSAGRAGFGGTSWHALAENFWSCCFSGLE